jgi:hypothetical protein
VAGLVLAAFARDPVPWMFGARLLPAMARSSAQFPEPVPRCAVPRRAGRALPRLLAHAKVMPACASSPPDVSELRALASHVIIHFDEDLVIGTPR